jgi:hypothetical protein
MKRLNASAGRLRRIEVVVLSIGVIIAVISLFWDSQQAFHTNIGSSAGVERIVVILVTTFAFLVLGLVLIAPYVLLFILGKVITSNGNANLYQVAGLVISCLVTIASIFLYIDAHQVVTQDSSSTAGLVILAIPIVLGTAGGIPYFIVTLLHSRAQKKDDVEP